MSSDSDLSSNADDVLNWKELENQMNSLVDTDYIQGLLKLQILEFEMLQSMFSNPGELCLDDCSVLAHFRNYVDGKTLLVPNHLDFTVRLVIETNKLDICVNLPTKYPDYEPDVFVRSDELNRNQQRLINEDLTNYINSLDRGDICIGSAIAWLQENAVQYFDDTKAEVSDVGDKLPDGSCNIFARFWIYSHHIYSKTKRRMILDLAHEYALTGFSLPGKPGIICIEGLSSDCEEWWSKVKSMNWKKIMCKKKEESKINERNADEFRKFSDFHEVTFEGKASRGRDYHMDFGEFHKYLMDHNCKYMFKEYFGIEGK